MYVDLKISRCKGQAEPRVQSQKMLGKISVRTSVLCRQKARQESEHITGGQTAGCGHCRSGEQPEGEGREGQESRRKWACVFFMFCPQPWPADELIRLCYRGGSPPRDEGWGCPPSFPCTQKAAMAWVLWLALKCPRAFLHNALGGMVSPLCSAGPQIPL